MLTMDNNIRYVIGTDTFDKGVFTYCLLRRVGDICEVLLLKSMHDEGEFEEEVKNLSKYFNADWVVEHN